MGADGNKCIICGVGSENGKKGVCSNCGNPTKIIATCIKCHAKFDLSEKKEEELAKFTGQEVTFGTAIAMPWCPKCTDDNGRKGEALIYRVRPKARA
ncbi:MAG: hypothetical protein A2Y98_02240 [Candidatus Portnoybacteria bacterium RBG_19FT_COMBO_36_7]|uniref:Uncharacterized protein n=1 Tax=Candidatus Portnoybacteria bacterium RBG_19FT_COMBO_36_7 TaxID=1801992 RepID=A0A1G2F9A7_9BACT|nr:MAG: hypothetical protein A2Y98_02240 [Candidatus Portnoybacteria bacterium RBG_19FT_COMBO_36_7]